MRVISGKARGTILYTLEGEATRPTLDRVKEALFNILQNEIRDARVLDLFAGSGALGIEALSRGAKEVIFSDKSVKAIQIIKKNIEKTHFEKQCDIVNQDYEKIIKNSKEKFDVIFLDPPYEADIATNAVKLIMEYELLQEDGMIVLETDQEKRELKKLKEINVNLYDLRKYGRIRLIFLNRKG